MTAKWMCAILTSILGGIFNASLLAGTTEKPDWRFLNYAMRTPPARFHLPSPTSKRESL
jgi:hypothetical protein